MPFGYLKKMFFKTRPKKAQLTRTSTLPEINLASPIYIVIDSAEDEPISNTIDDSNQDLLVNSGGGRNDLTGGISPSAGGNMMVKPAESPLVTPPPPIVIDDDDDDVVVDSSNRVLNGSSNDILDSTSDAGDGNLASPGLTGKDNAEQQQQQTRSPSPANFPDSPMATSPFFQESPSGKKSIKGSPRKSGSPVSNLVATRFLSQSTSNINETNWQEDHRRNNPADGSGTAINSGSLLQLPGEEGMMSAQSENDLSNLDEKSQKSALIARRVAKSGGRSGSWRKTWSRSFRKNILGLDDPDDPEAARLRKYRTRRKKYGGKHFIIALYNCGKAQNSAGPKTPVMRSNSTASGSGAVIEENGIEGEEPREEKEPDTFCIEIMEEMNFESRNDPTRLLPDLISDKHREKLKKTLANFFYADNITEQIAYNYFVADLNNEVKEFIHMRFPFVIVFYHEEDEPTIKCAEIVKVLKSISHDYNLFKIDVLSDMVFGSRNNEEKKLSLNMPYVYVFGHHFEKSDKLAYHENCSSCEMLDLIITQRSIEVLQLNNRSDLYEKIMHNKLLRNNFFHTALITYNLVMCGLYSPVEGMMGRKSGDKTRVEDDADDDYLSD